MKKYFSLAIFIATLLIPTQVWACGYRQAFFRNSSLGDIALIKDAQYFASASTTFSNWCALEEGTDFAPKFDGKIYFGLNNRDETAGVSQIYIVKIYRRSRATEFRPLVSLFRNGDWVPQGCDGPARVNPFKAVSFGRTAFAELLNRASSAASSTPVCDMFGQWLATVSGDASLSILSFRDFILQVPNRVRETGREKWSVNISAFSYKTVNPSDRTAKFPILEINRDGASEMIVQYINSGSKFHEFSVR